MFPYLYTALGICIYLLALPFLLIASLKPKYRRSIPARFFLYKNPPFTKQSIHFHVCSFGEARAIAPLVEAVEEPNISVITQTGYEEAKRLSEEVRYLPFEPWLWLWLKPQKALVVFEAELWYLLFFLSKRRGAKTLLLNARMSDRSFPRYMRLRWFYRRVFANIDKIYAQSEKDKKRLEALGAKDVEVVGNLKLLQKPVPTKKYEKEGYLIVAASTHDPEEEIIATAWLEAGKEGILAIAPRHPERFDEVDELLAHIAKREGLSYHRLSEREDLRSDIVLVDRLGELINLYSVAECVILGGSFVEGVGGHNPIEPAFFHKPIISGPHYFNQQESYASVEGIEVVEPSELKEALAKPCTPTKIVKEVDMEPILRELRDVV